MDPVIFGDLLELSLRKTRRISDDTINDFSSRGMLQSSACASALVDRLAGFWIDEMSIVATRLGSCISRDDDYAGCLREFCQKAQKDLRDRSSKALEYLSSDEIKNAMTSGIEPLVRLLGDVRAGLTARHLAERKRQRSRDTLDRLWHLLYVLSGAAVGFILSSYFSKG